jgi:hypothetical protein
VSAAVCHDRWHEVVTIASSRENTNTPINASVEGFDHFELDIRERLGLDHSTKKYDILGAKLSWRQGAAGNAVAGICDARESEQSDGSENDRWQRLLHHGRRSLRPNTGVQNAAWLTAGISRDASRIAPSADGCKPR